MMDDFFQTLELLNGEDGLKNLRALVDEAGAGGTLPPPSQDVNNHIHTTYSFSPYSPAAAVWFAVKAGLCTCGLMDHDTIAGADEFLAACGIANIPGTIGLECRVRMDDTPFWGRRINNPDQDGVIYMAIHGVPHNEAAGLNAFFAPYREKRNERNRRMIARVNEYMRPFGVSVDFDHDVLPISNYSRGGTVTERHLSMALAEKMLAATGSGAALVRMIREEMRLPIPAKIEAYLADDANGFRAYDLLGWIKSELIAKFYIDAADECPHVSEALALAERIGAISAYAYLGDVGDSVTGDKRSQVFEDGFLAELLPYLKGIGFRAVTYMPSRNTPAQIERLRRLLTAHDFFQISGEDINSPRQGFVCEAQRAAEFRNLYDSTYALIAHERRAAGDAGDGLFGAKSARKWPSLNERTAAFAEMGRSTDM